MFAAEPDKLGPDSPTNVGWFSAFQAIARHFERPTSADVLLSGAMPDQTSPELEDLVRIAERIGMEVSRQPNFKPSGSSAMLPALLELADGRFLAVLERLADGKLSVVVGGQTNRSAIDDQLLAQAKIKNVYSFTPVYLNASERRAAGEGEQIEKRHWLFGTIRTFWRGYVYVALAAMFINLIALAIPIFTMNVYDRVLPNKATSSLLALAAGAALALLFDLILKTARSSIIDQTGREADVKLSYLLFDKVLHANLAARPGSTGEYANRISQIEFVREFFTSNTISTVIDSFFVFIFIGVIYLIGGWIAVIPFIALILAFIIGFIAQHRIGKRVAKAANESAQRQSLLVEAISTMETVKSLKAEGLLLRKWNELTKKSSGTSEEIKQLSSSAAIATAFVQQLVSIVLIVAGAFEFANGNISSGAIIAIVMLSGRAVAPLSQITMTLARMRQATLSLRILDTIMNLPDDRPASAGFVSRPIANGRFQFEDASFTYPGSDHAVLKSLNLNVSAGERVGIIGKIGSGKTTIGRVLSGLYTPTAGRLLIDGIDVRQYHPAIVRGSIFLVGQSADLFSGTLKENLLMAKQDATDDEILVASKKAGVDDFAILHPRGYDLPVGERGSNLSGGQRQAVALARMFLAKPKIVFLDEPTGSMDLASEKLLTRNFATAFDRDVTLVISTHRYSLLELVDRLVVLDNGRIVADGPKQKVLDALAARMPSVRVET